MNRYFALLISTMVGILSAIGVHAQTATLLPNAIQYFMDNNGKPLSNGKVYFYVPPGTTPKTVWSDPAKTTPQVQPVPLGISGRPANPIYGDGTYRQVVQDQFNNVIWDFNTSSTGSGTSGGGSVFQAGVLVGTILPWSGTVLPTNYLYTAGQAVSRTTYAQLLAAITYQPNILCSSGIATISVSTAISDGTPIGAPIEASCFVPGTVVSSKTSGSLTLSNNATVSVSTSAIIFPWGNGDGATTFNVPDSRGRAFVGRDNMDGTIAGTLTSTYYMTPARVGVNPDALNAVGGSQSWRTLVAELPAGITSSGSNNLTVTSTVAGIPTNAVPAATISSSGASTSIIGPSGGTQPVVVGAITSTNTQQINVTVNNTGDLPHTSIQPSVTADYIIKALPDTSNAGLTGANNGVLYNNAGAPGVITAGLDGQVLLGVTGSPPQMATMSQDCTITNAGVITCLKTNNVAFGPFATQSSPCQISQGCTSQTTVLTSRGPSGLNIDEATSTGDADYAIQPTDRMVYHTALSTARVDTLPAASSINPGQLFVISDFRGVASGTNTITIQRNGATTDTINGVTSVVAVNLQYGAAAFWSDGVSRWTFLPGTTGVGSGTVTQVVCGSGLTGGIITNSGTCALDPSQLAGAFGGRLTLVSGQAFMTTDVTSQNLYYAPDIGKTAPIHTSGGSWILYPFVSSSTDQVGLTLALAGSADWPADSIHDVFLVNDAGTVKLATRQWDASMLPTTTLITPSTSAGSPGFITTGTTNAWTRASTAFDGTLVKNTASSALVTSVSGLLQCLGQDWGAGVTKVVSQVVATTPTDGFLLGNQGIMNARLYGSNDNTNWLELSVNWINDAAMGETLTMPVNQTNATAQYGFRYHRECFDAEGGFVGSSLKLAQLQFFTTDAPATRRLTLLDGTQVNDAVMTARTAAGTTISVPQYSGSYVGAIHIDTGANGSVTANFSTGPSRTYGVSNFYRPIPVTLRANVPYTITTPGAVFYNLTSQLYTPCTASSTYSVQVLQGIAARPVELVAPRSITLNATVAAAGFETAIGVDSTSAYSGINDSGNLDISGATAGQVIGFTPKPYLTMPPYAGIHTYTCLERVNNGGGTVSVFPLNRSSVLKADFYN